MAGEWTEERRRTQAERCRQQKPWEKSTGPKSDAGKERSSMNAVKHGNRSRTILEVKRKSNAVFAIHELFIRHCRAMDFSLDCYERMANELIKKRSKSEG